MSENESGPEPTDLTKPEPGPEPVAEAVAADVPAESVEPAEPVAAAEAPARRRRAATLVGALLLVGGVVGGVGYTVVTVDGADRDAGAPVWTFPKAAAETAKPAAAKGLSGMLLPYGGDSAWRKGPDIGEYGNDAVLSGAHATALRKESLSGLPRTQRKALERQIDKQRLKGIAMRSYLSSPYDQQSATVTVELSQMENASAVREIARYQEKFVDVLDDVLRPGPKIVDHKDARCFLAPADEDEKLDTMFCFAHQGNVLVSLTAESAKPMVQEGVAKLLREQLDRIAEPGESV
ncbi:hypothetical protein ABZ896_30165 [Streptomyces sp. NPDC047072]|uniref:hypothetical protein n=1 Tax=Streptomyces sp. NPDC047072 TaxID=3154809 RepID=UPI003400FF8F